MYHKKSMKQLHSNAPILIGVSGIEAGCGVTHSCIAFATYVYRVKGQSVAYVEMNGSHQIHCLVQKDHWQGDCFRYGGITFYPNAGQATLELVLNKGYDAVFIDFGCKPREVFKHAPVCNIRFVLASGALWHQSRLEDWLKSQDMMALEQHQYLIPMADSVRIKSLTRMYTISFQAIPCQSNPFELTPTMIQFLTKLL